MTDSNKRQQHNNEAQAVMGTEQYRCFDISMTSVGNNRICVYSRRSDKSIMLPPPAIQLLSFCDKFDTLPNHAAAYCRKQNWDRLRSTAAGKSGSIITRLFSPFLRYALREGIEIPLREKNITAIIHQLAGFVQAGLLVSERSIRTEIVEMTERDDTRPVTSNTITTVGIPTRDRPDILARAVASFIENSQRHGRQTEFVIVDDSRETVKQQENRSILGDIASQLGENVYYADRQGRLEYAKALSRYSQVPLEVLEFALLGDNRCNFTFGASRNALLLHSAGEVCLQTDDDTICKIAPSPEIEKGQALSSGGNPNDLWFFQTREAAFEAVSPVEKDFLGLHEKLLGKNLNSWLSANIRDGINFSMRLYLDEMSPAFLKNMYSSTAKVAVTHLGAVGDSGLRQNSNALRLFLKGGSYNRLIKSEQDYQVGLNTREILRVAQYNTISDGTLFISMNIGLDNRRLLPPYIPVQRREDGIFGRVLRVCFTSSYSGFLPYVLYHDPPENRSEAPEDIFNSLRSFRMNDLLDLLICSFQSWPCDSDSAKNLRTLGHFLMDLSSLSPADFKEYIRSTCSNAIRANIQRAEQSFNENSRAPEYWVRDMQVYILTLLETLTQSDIFIPCDLPGTDDERQTLFKELVNKFGELLVNWPDIVEAAKELRNQGQLLVSKALVEGD